MVLDEHCLKDISDHQAKFITIKQYLHNRIYKPLEINKSLRKKNVQFPSSNYFLTSTAFDFIHYNGLNL